jgi:glyoxylase-like metal-dependent hydrolase (beta-lactamase superfamily II)/rhodanese-related sulfurtransferase
MARYSRVPSRDEADPVYFRQFYLGCLAQASYLIGSDGEAAVVDPRRDVDEYLEAARDQGLAIRFVIETHLHADFVSGHRELAERTGAEIVFGHRAGAAFPHRAVRDGDELRIGRVLLRVLETPGHTLESISVLVIDEETSPEPRLVLTGDTLFIGDVGRPDLAASRGVTAEDMAGMLFESLHGKLLTLPDEVAVYPAHGAGSLCGRNISKETSSTIGEQRRTNYALQPMPRERFVAMATADLPEAPDYFPRDVALNREGAATLPAPGSAPGLGPEAVRERAEGGALVLDVRSSAAYGTGHVPGALNVGLGGQYASWAGTLIAPGTPIVIVAEEPEAVGEAVTRLARVGIDSVVGHLDGGIAAWDRAGLPLERVSQIAVDELRGRMAEGLAVLDVRRKAEWAAGHVPGASHVPLDRLPREMGHLDASRPLAVICAGGYRSSAACSLLRRAGFTDVLNVVGGTTAWTAAGYETEVHAG